MRRKVVGFLLTTGAGAALAFGQSKVNNAEMRFMDKAAQGGIAEVKLGQLAMDKASNQVVKDFGQRMVTDHTNINNQLMQVAAKDGVTLPTTMDAKDQATYDRLSKLSGTAFDRAYMHDMVRDHETDISEFRHESQVAKTPDVKGFVQNTTPILEQHLTLAKEDSSKVGISAQR